MAQTDRKYDIVFWGASGFTGQLTCEYIATKIHAGELTLRWAIGGRNEAKLKSIQAQLKAQTEGQVEPDILLGNSHDLNSLLAITQQTRVVCSTVGPYLEYGSLLIQACVENQTHYCDLTGEVPWIQKMVDQHHEKAAANRTKIVNCCGFDSIPSDMGCLVLQEHAIANHQAPADEVTLYVMGSKGGFSGGTLASMIGMMDQAKQDKSIRKALFDPYALNPEDQREGPDGRDQTQAIWAEDIQKWTAPFIMAGINTRVVRRSNALQAFKYGKDFRYHETMAMQKGLKGRFRAEIFRLGLGIMMGFIAWQPVRNLMLGSLLPKPGQGPSADERENGFFNMLLVGNQSTNTNTNTTKVRVRGKRDPGYGATSRMLSQAALSLAQDTNLPETYGLLTPATAFGMDFVPRLAKADITFSIESSP